MIASMPGTLVRVNKKEGDSVTVGEPLAMLSAMKMETLIAATNTGKIKKIVPQVGDLVAAGDLILEIE